MVKNSGFAFNRFDAHPKAVAAVSVLATACVGYKTFMKRNDESFFGWALLLCGAVSNSAERIFKGYVTDYIKIGRYEYNAADFMIFIGSALIIKGELWKE